MITQRDENGRIVPGGKQLSSEEARELRSHVKDNHQKAQAAEAAILAEMGYSDDNPAPAIIQELAGLATSRRANSTSAISQLLKIAHTNGAGADGISLIPPSKPGDICPLCGLPFLTTEQAQVIYAGIDEELKRRKTLLQPNESA